MAETITIDASVLEKLRGVALNFQLATIIAARGQGKGEMYRDLCDKITYPKVGDLVVEVSSYWPDNEENANPNSIGFLLEKDHEQARGRVKIKTLDGREVEWTNSRFIGMPHFLK